MRQLTLVVCCASAAFAQTTVHVPDSATTIGPINTAPLGAQGPTGGWQNLRTQILVPRSFLPAAGSTIRDVALVGGSDGYYAYGLFELRLAHATSSTLTATFATNVAGEQLVSRRQNTRVDVRRDAWSSLGQQVPFTHDGVRDLVVDIVIQGAVFQGLTAGTRRSSTLETVYALDYDVGSPAASGFGPFLAGAKLALTLGAATEPTVVGLGCAKADGRSPAIGYAGRLARGASFTVSLLDATPNSAALFALGSNDQSFGSYTLPLDLTAFGARGCLWRTDIALGLAWPTDALGNAQIVLPIPGNASMLGRRVLTQWFAVAPLANSLGAAVSPLLAGTIQ